MKLIKVESITDINTGDTIIISGKEYIAEPFKVVTVKVSDSDGTEIIINKKLNKYFNLGMFLKGESWVDECYILKPN